MRSWNKLEEYVRSLQAADARGQRDKAMTPTGQTLGLASPEPDTDVGISLVSRLENQEYAETGYARPDQPLVDSEEIFWKLRRQSL